MKLLINIRRWKKSHHACLVVASVFLFFIISAAPHRVHHFFEQGSIPSARAESHSRHDRSATDPHGDDHESPPSKEVDCAAQSSAQNTHFAPLPLIDVAFKEIATRQSEQDAAAFAAAFNPAPLSQRAPPLV